MAWDPVHFGTCNNERFTGDCHPVEIQHGRIVLDFAQQFIAKFLWEVPIGTRHADDTIAAIRCAEDTLVIIDWSKMPLPRWLHTLIIAGFLPKRIGVKCSDQARESLARRLVGAPQAHLDVAGPIGFTKESPRSWDPLGLMINKEESRRQKYRLVEANHGRINSYTILGALSLDRSRWADNTLRSLALNFADIQKYMSVFLGLPVAQGWQMFFFAGYITINAAGEVEAEPHYGFGGRDSLTPLAF